MTVQTHRPKCAHTERFVWDVYIFMLIESEFGKNKKKKKEEKKRSLDKHNAFSHHTFCNESITGLNSIIQRSTDAPHLEDHVHFLSKSKLDELSIQFFNVIIILHTHKKKRKEKADKNDKTH